MSRQYVQQRHLSHDVKIVFGRSPGWRHFQNQLIGICIGEDYVKPYCKPRVTAEEPRRINLRAIAWRPGSTPAAEELSRPAS